MSHGQPTALCQSVLSVSSIVCVHTLSLPLCPSLWDLLDCSPPGSSAHGILQAKVLEWVAISFSRGSSWPWSWTHVSYASCTGGQTLYHWATCIISYQLQMAPLEQWIKCSFSSFFLKQPNKRCWRKIVIFSRMNWASLGPSLFIFSHNSQIIIVLGKILPYTANQRLEIYIWACCVIVIPSLSKKGSGYQFFLCPLIKFKTWLFWPYKQQTNLLTTSTHREGKLKNVNLVAQLPFHFLQIKFLHVL